MRWPRRTAGRSSTSSEGLCFAKGDDRACGAFVEAEVLVVAEGRGGDLEVGGRRYTFEHVEGGRFVISFPCGHRHRERDDDLIALKAVVDIDPTRWSIDDRRRLR